MYPAEHCTNQPLTGNIDRRKFLGTAGATATCLAVLGTARGEDATTPTQPARQSPFVTRGVYIHDGFTVEPRSHAPLYWDRETWQREIRWLDACGINAIEFATMLEFSRLPSTELERRKISDRLHLRDYAHSLGNQFAYQLSNTAVSTVPAGDEPGHQLKDRAVMLCPRQPGNFEKTLGIQKFFLDTYRCGLLRSNGSGLGRVHLRPMRRSRVSTLHQRPGREARGSPSGGSATRQYMVNL